MYYNSRKKSKKLKWQGILSASLFSVLGLITFFKFATGLTNILLGVFGLMFYPMIILAVLVSCGIAFNMKFSLSGKNLSYLVLSVISLELLLHTAFVAKFATEHGVKISHYFDFLGMVATMKSGVTVGGLIASLVAYPFMCLLSPVGACILFAIMLTVFVSLCVDYYLVARNFEENKKVKSMLQRNGDNKYAYKNDTICSNLTSVGTSDDISTRELNQNYTSKFIDEEENSDENEQREGYVFDGYSEETPSIIETSQPQVSNGYDFINGDKENSRYDPNKFSSASEYITYKYSPTIYKNQRNQENASNNEEENQSLYDSEETYGTDYANDNTEPDGYGYASEETVANEKYLSEEETESSVSSFTEEFNTSIFTGQHNENTRERRDSGSTFDNSPFSTFNTGEQIGVDNSRVRGRDSEVFPSTAKTFFDDSPVQKKEPEQLPIFKNIKPQKYGQEKDKKYNAPPTTLLELCSDDESTYGGDYQAKSAALEQVLSSFNIDAKVSNIVRGPTVTQYELSMPYGTSVKKILTYDGDIAAALMSRGGVRIEAPILGKNAVGVEVPNDTRSKVGLRELLESKEFQTTTSNLPIVMGKSVSGEVIVKSLPKLVHCLVAGSTGSGKSVFLHSLILSLMYKCSPSQLRFIMIDPKRVEFTTYSGMPHMMLPNAVSECDKAINALGWAVKEMDRRFKKLQQYKVQNIQDFNHLKEVTDTHEEEQMAYLVIIIDELNDLMMVGKKEVEEKITRLAQLGRASGIHLIIATQRPSADVITGTIKNNLPTRVAFSLGSAIDSRVILDESGAEKLLSHGDMLLSANGSNSTVRLQGGFAEMDEVRKVVEYIKSHNESYFDEELEKEILADRKEEVPADGGSGKNGPNTPALDELLPAALKLCIETGGASINLVQRRFSVGYARAARIVDQMELAGYISQGNGSKLRTVYMTMSEFKEKFGED